tara:strand:- start:272 stop:1300 length:1029 start_codon:yes stop_codon:yes gene_type:complete
MSPMSQQTRSRSLTFVVVTAITLLIWIWAAGETRDSATLYARVGFTTASNFNVIVGPTEDQQVAISVQGSARSIQRLRTALEEPVRLMTGSNGIPQEAGQHQVSLSEALQGLESFVTGDISVVSTEPAKMEVEIDSMTQLAVPVEALMGDATLGGEAIPNPSTATLTLPSRIVALVPDAKVLAEPTKSSLAGLDPGRRHVIIVPLRLPRALRPFEDEIRIEPKSVDLAFNLILRTSTLTLEDVPVQIAFAITDHEDYVITVDENDRVLADVVIEGSTEAINAFEEEMPAVSAFVVIDDEDLSEGTIEVPISLWQLPEGLRVVSVESETEPPAIRISITPRAE